MVDEVAKVFDLTVDDSAETVIDGNPHRPTIISPQAYQRAFEWEPPSLADGLQRYADAT